MVFTGHATDRARNNEKIVYANIGENFRCKEIKLILIKTKTQVLGYQKIINNLLF